MELFERLGSTNDEVRRLPVPWRVVVAQRQDAGRGRLGRSWTTTPGTGLAVSVLVPAPASGASWVPLLAGLAVHRAVEEVAGVATSLKWPNDVLVPGDGDRKLAGLLCEWIPEGVVVGLGLNVDTARADLPLGTATSLRAAGAPGTDRAALLTAVLVHLAALLRDDTGPGGAVQAAYSAACGTLGREVEVHEPGGTVRSGVATGVDGAGRLTVRTENGTDAVSAGDVVHVRSR
ncbi:biotin--[acetyl-CoA-carboxylase] ligase [Fodinibacter luteus]|uniref:biotin--[biotin carboxyl-carrier protein] ligase n=1 Tax=Fodinibacter luteus TaxID=552064 RepID=A0ABP8JZB1_9MICO